MYLCGTFLFYKTQLPNKLFKCFPRLGTVHYCTLLQVTSHTHSLHIHTHHTHSLNIHTHTLHITHTHSLNIHTHTLHTHTHYTSHTHSHYTHTHIQSYIRELSVGLTTGPDVHRLPIRVLS